MLVLVGAKRFPPHVLLPLAAVPVLLASATLSYRSIRLYKEQNQRLEHTRIILRNAANLRDGVRRVESAHTGYLLSGKSSYAARYRTLLPRVQRDLAALSASTVKDPEDKEAVAEITRIVNDKVAQMDRTIQLYRSGNRQQALAESETDQSDEVMRSAVDLLDVIRQAEQKNFNESIAGGASRARDSFLMSTGGDVALLLCLIVAASMIQSEDRQRRRDEGAIRVLNEQLGSELKQRTEILQSIQDGFFAVNAEGSVTYVNPAAARMFGVKPEDLVGRFYGELLGVGGARELPFDLSEIARRGEAVTAEQFLPDRGKWFLLRLYPAGEHGVTVYATDITERKEAEADRIHLLHEIQEAQALLDAIFENAPVGLCFLDRSLQYVRVNRALAEIDGIPASEHVGKSVSELRPPLDASVEEPVQRVLKTGEPLLAQEITTSTAAHWENERIYIVSFFPVRMDGEVAGVGVVCEDVTRRRLAERGIQQAAKLESLGVLAGGVAHDFNNLLTGILGNASLALDEVGEGSPAGKFMQDVVVASERAAGLTRQLLAYAGKGQFALAPTNLCNVVRELEALVRLSVPKRVRLVLELPNRLPNVIADVSQIQPVIMNFVINAAEAIPAEAPGLIGIRLGVVRSGDPTVDTMKPAPKPAASYVSLEVFDNGIGMDEGTIGRIFDPFFTTKFTGRGLGLAAALGVIQAHNAGLKVESTPGKGTRFVVLFPASSETIAAPESSRRRDISGRQDINGTGTILVVEDEEVVRQATKASLERFGYSVVLAHDGLQGVQALTELGDEVALVLLDLTMPVMSGELALRKMRALRPELKVVLSSGFSEMEAIERFAQVHVTGFLQKPYTSRRLAEAVANALQSDGEMQKPNIQI